MAHKQQSFTGPSALSHSKPCTARPQPPKSQIPRPVKGKPCLARPSVLAGPPPPHHRDKLSLQILHSPGVNKAITVFPSEEDLLLHMSTLVPLPSVCANKETWMPAEPCSVPTISSTTSEELEVESPDSLDSQTSTTSYSLCPGCLSPTMRQPSADYKGDHRLSPATTCPYPSPATESPVQMKLMATLHLVTQVILMAPL